MAAYTNRVRGQLAIGSLLCCSMLNVVKADMRIVPGEQSECALELSYELDGQILKETVHFLLFIPRDYDKSDKSSDTWPMLLFLHGLGESGNNELDRVKIHGPPGKVAADPSFPFVLVSPQCPPPGMEWDAIIHAWKPPLLLQLLDAVANQVRIAPDRVYVTGLSMGGYGTWRLASAAPQRFAAIAPVCGGGEVQMAEALANVPIWCFHGAEDTVVKLSESQKMVDAVQQHGGDVKFTIYPDVGHNAWEKAYGDRALFDWLLTKRKARLD